MFSGIVEAMGVIAVVVDGDGRRELGIDAPDLAAELAEGQSVSIDGACHTVTRVQADRFFVESITTTLARTIAGTYRIGSRVNLERALALGDRLDGHLVQGHVDGVGSLAGVSEEGETRLMDFRLPAVVAEVTVSRGSIAVNGVSLTVSDMVDPGLCRVGVIPYTWEHTNLGSLSPGAPVNLEGDLIGKHVGRMLATRAPHHQLGDRGP